MKKIFALILAVVLCVGLLAGCGNAGGSGADNSGSGNSGTASSGKPWPTDTVTMYVPATAGGGTDVLARVFIEGMKRANGANYIVVNDMAGNGTVACDTVRTADPDGLNLLMYHSAMCSNFAIGQYDHGIEDFQMLGLFTTPNMEVAANGIYVPKDSPFNTFEELVEYAKAHPGELTCGVQNGGNAHFGTCLLEDTVGYETIKVDSGANVDRITALMGGQLDLSLIPTMTAAAYSKSGDLKCLMTYGAAAGCDRDPNEPDIPTLGEINAEWDQALPRVDLTAFIVGPKGMSEEDIANINGVIKAASEDPEVLEGYAKMGTVIEYQTVEEAEQTMLIIQNAFIQAAPLVTGH